MSWAAFHLQSVVWNRYVMRAASSWRDYPDQVNYYIDLLRRWRPEENADMARSTKLHDRQAVHLGRDGRHVWLMNAAGWVKK
jgi:hypothetical protein